MFGAVRLAFIDDTATSGKHGERLIGRVPLIQKNDHLHAHPTS
jgi:hypothetical protein